MIYIKVPHDTVPGEIIGLTPSNTFTTCARCGREMTMSDPFLQLKEDQNCFGQQYICAKCCMREYQMEQFARLTSFFERLLLPEGNQEDNEDEQ